MSFNITANKTSIVEGNTVIFTVTAINGAVPTSYTIISSIRSSYLARTPLVPTGVAGTYTCTVTVNVGGMLGDMDSLFIKVQTGQTGVDTGIVPNTVTPFTTASQAFVTIVSQAAANAAPVGPAPSNNNSGGGGGCFPGSATVTLKTGKRCLMKDLQLGQEVLASPEGVYSPVYLFSHSLPDAEVTFVKISTGTGLTLCLTAGHYLFVNDTAVPASTVQPGDTLNLADWQTDVVLSVTTERLTGLFNPHTLSGNLMVDGIYTTSYTTAVHPTLAHAVLAPVRFMYTMGLLV